MMKALPLNVDDYRPYGEVIAARADVSPVRANLGTADRYNRLAELENRRPGAATPNLCVFRIDPFQDAAFQVAMLERHPGSTQLFVPMTCDRRYLVIVCLGGDAPDLSTLRAFVASRDQGITYRPGVWHHPLVALDEVTDFACLVFEDDSSGDCQVHRLAKPVLVELA